MAANPSGTGARAAGRSFRSGNFAIEIDGKFVGYISSVEGGEAVGEVVVEPIGVESFARKHIGGVKYADVTVTADLSLDPLFYAWISDTLQRKNLRRDVSVVTLDFNQKVRWKDEYFNALITEIAFPASDASSKESAYLTVKYSPEYTRSKKGDGSTYKHPASKAQKKWLTSNFSFQIDGVDSSKVNKVDSFTIKQLVSEEAVGEQRDYGRIPGRIEYPNLSVSMPEAGAQTIIDWHDDFVIKGNNGSDAERKGTLTYLTPDLKTPVGVINFTGLGIYRVAKEKRETSSEQIARIRADLYVEQISVSLGDTA